MTCPRTPPGRTTNSHYFASGMCIFCATPDPRIRTPQVHLAFAGAGVQDTLCGQPTASNTSTQQITESTCTACRAELVQEVAR